MARCFRCLTSIIAVTEADPYSKRLDAVLSIPILRTEIGSKAYKRTEKEERKRRLTRRTFRHFVHSTLFYEMD